jgi:tetratricopeptide (TPR) repeat protein
MAVGQRPENWKDPRPGTASAFAGADRAQFHSFSVANGLLAACLFVGLFWLGWQIVVDTAAHNIALSDPERALAWSATEVLALDEMAYREVKKSDGDLDSARLLAERALRTNPLDARALALLGLLAEREGDAARAANLMRLSGVRTRRDANTQAWLLNYEIGEGNFDQALIHIDAVLRSNPRVLDLALPVFAAFALDKQTFDALARLFASNPPWRAQVLTRLSPQLSDVSRLTQLYTALEQSKNPPSSSELKPYLDRLIKDDQYAEARRAWRETLPTEKRVQESLLYNGDFASPVDGLPFNWVLYPAQGVNIQVVPSAKNGASRALLFQFSGARAGDFTASQFMLLSPGAYRFTGHVRAQEFRTQRGLAWEISCADSPNNVLGRSVLVANSTPRVEFSADFVVPEGGCRGQWLKLAVPARTPSERQIEGRVWYDELQIAPN